MFNLPFFKKNKKAKISEPAKLELDKDRVYLALDVGTRYIKSVLFQQISSTEIKVIGFARVAQRYGSMRDAMIVNLQSVIEACDVCVGKALDVAEKRLGTIQIPEQVIIGIAGELVKGVSIVAEYERENPQEKISAGELETVVSQVKSETFAGALDHIASEVGLPADQLAEIDTKIDTTEVDGTILNNPLGFTGKNVSYRVFSSFAPEIHLRSLYELAAGLGLRESTVVVQPYAVARATEDVHANSGGAIVIDMGGGTTDVALIYKGSVLGTKMFAFGGEVLTRRIAEMLDLELPKAEELKIDYSDATAPESIAKEIKTIVNQDLKIWVEGVQIALEELLDDEDGDLEQLPGQIYLCGGGTTLPEVREFLLAHPWLTVLPFDKFPRVEYLYPNQLVGIQDETRLLIEPGDVTPVSVARMLIDKTER